MWRSAATPSNPTLSLCREMESNANAGHNEDDYQLNYITLDAGIGWYSANSGFVDGENDRCNSPWYLENSEGSTVVEVENCQGSSAVEVENIQGCSAGSCSENLSPHGNIGGDPLEPTNF